MEVSDLVICALVALVTLLVAAVFYESKAARAGDAAGEGLSEREEQIIERMTLQSDNLAEMRASNKMKRALEEFEEKRGRLILGTLNQQLLTMYNLGISENVSLDDELDRMKRALKETEEKMERLVDRRMQAECAAAVAEARLSDLRAWEKAVKLFSSALKDADASARAALCKDPEGAIEKLMEGQTVEKVTGEQAQEDAQQ
ncbi:unnamed protein product [Pelagomonas calceolata]|uniref:Uncharacterized protein n=1 Tax=Pelagomonas calceolata TaxID=35677 RepID=A0A8J2SEM9_9STRA|nr:unnamed protein product [Pelagomonas calceolata]